MRAVLGPSKFDELRDFQGRLRTHPRIAMALARAAAGIALRRVDPTRPSSWEFAGFSQNGEDGIIDYLCDRLVKPDRYFIEI